MRLLVCHQRSSSIPTYLSKDVRHIWPFNRIVKPKKRVTWFDWPVRCIPIHSDSIYSNLWQVPFPCGLYLALREDHISVQSVIQRMWPIDSLHHVNVWIHSQCARLRFLMKVWASWNRYGSCTLFRPSLFFISYMIQPLVLLRVIARLPLVTGVSSSDLYDILYCPII